MSNIHNENRSKYRPSRNFFGSIHYFNRFEGYENRPPPKLSEIFPGLHKNLRRNKLKEKNFCIKTSKYFKDHAKRKENVELKAQNTSDTIEGKRGEAEKVIVKEQNNNNNWLVDVCPVNPDKELNNILANAIKKINYQFNKVDVMKITVNIGKEWLVALIDTGTDVQLISETAAKEANLKIFDRKYYPLDLKGIGGDSNDLIKTIGLAKAAVKIAEIKMKEDDFFVIPDNLMPQGISLFLGYSFFHNNKISIDFVEHQLVIKRNEEGNNKFNFVKIIDLNLNNDVNKINSNFKCKTFYTDIPVKIMKNFTIKVMKVSYIQSR